MEQPVTVALRGNSEITVKMNQLSIRAESVSVTADVNDLDVTTPDPAMKVFASENLLDANPGRPGAPISIPGYPIETASGGIKAPQYFAPGVAGDHGEPIAQYIQAGSYLVPNNLSANAHGNGYSDPNIYIARLIESVQVDGGAYNVREGNHALNLATVYGLRSYLNPFISLTADYRDATLTAGMSVSPDSWIAMEGSFGDMFLDRLEHRKQFKLNGGRVFHGGDHTLTSHAALATHSTGSNLTVFHASRRTGPTKTRKANRSLFGASASARTIPCEVDAGPRRFITVKCRPSKLASPAVVPTQRSPFRV